MNPPTELQTITLIASHDFPQNILIEPIMLLGDIKSMETTVEPTNPNKKVVTIAYTPTQGKSNKLSHAPWKKRETNVLNPQNNVTNRLFCAIPTYLPEADLDWTILQTFSMFGPVEYHHIVRNKRGIPTITYVKYFYIEDATQALINVDKIWKASYAEERQIRTLKQGKPEKTLHDTCGYLVDWDTYDLHVKTCPFIQAMYPQQPTYNASY
ncbi:hypothetical protein TKK_0011612 [Trichogramma kaykai]|uniref:RRM domain-containing protein n=1 Tax=Trichogramma kaykai TaxID=54128 RepID=A0ABD2WQQ5_9HYME